VGVRERLRFSGSIQTPLAKNAGKRLRRLCRELKIESIAVCFLHSYANPVHEEKIKDQLASLELPITLSAELLPEFREYERLTTTLINAYLAPVISSYIKRLSNRLNHHSLTIQQSNGAVLPVRAIEKRAAHTVLSGPAGGVQGAFQLAKEMDIRQIITFDMGGTSTDVSLCDRKPGLTREYKIDGYPLHIQVLDIHTVGAGGGSIAHIDRGGLLQVGPESAGADPGPVCYGKGKYITVTDANFFLGRLISNAFLGGRMRLDFKTVKKKMTGLAAELGLTPRQTAQGIIRIVNSGMAKAVRAVSLERGYDPQDFSLMAYGGASGLHCCELAEELGIERIIVPARAGILSAQGMVRSDPALDYTRALFLNDHELRRSAIEAVFAPMILQGKKEILKFCGSGEITVERFLDLRYQGQSFELTVSFDSDFRENFHTLHEKNFGYAMDNSPLELVSIRCTLRLRRQPTPLPRQPEKVKNRAQARDERNIFFAHGREKVKVFQRKDLGWGHEIKSPALIIDDYTTILVTHGFKAEVDALNNLLINRISKLPAI
jgi:N-methylhydantoinase A